MSVVIKMSASDIANNLLDDEHTHWTREAAYGIAEYLLELSDDIGDIEYDRVAIRCDYSEHTFDSLQEYYSNCCDFEDCDSNDDIIEEISDHTAVIWYGQSTIVIQDF